MFSFSARPLANPQQKLCLTTIKLRKK